MAETPPLVWSNGQPMRREVLTQRIAGPSVTGIRSIHSGNPAGNLDPGKLARILRSAEDGAPLAYLELAEAMEERDLHYLSVLGTRKRAVSQLPIVVDPASDDAEHQRHADFIRDWIDRDELQDEIFDTLDAIGKGFSITEIVWETTATAWTPKALEWCDPRHFEFDRIDGVTPLLRGDGGQLEPLDPCKYIVHFHKAKSGLPIRGGLARAAAWSYMFKNFSIKNWVAFLDTYGMPIRIGRYDNGETEENRSILLNALSQLGSDAAAMFPKTMEIEFPDIKASAVPPETWKVKATFCDDQVSKAVLGQTATTDAKIGGLGSGKEHGEVRADIERSDAKKTAASYNRDLIIPMIALNFGPQVKYPRLRIGHEDPVDIAALVSAAEKLVPLGVKVSMPGLRKTVGLPAPEEGEEVLSVPVAAAPVMPPETTPQEGTVARGAGKLPKSSAPAFLDRIKSPTAGDRGNPATASEQVPAPAPDFVDLTTDEALSDWEELIAPILSPIDALLASATSIEDARGRLLCALDAMDAAALTELLARGGFAASMQGELDVQQGD